jgi:hypothetical protein
MTDPWQSQQPQDQPPYNYGQPQPPGYGGSPYPGQPSPYGGPPVYSGMREHPQGTLILVFGIMSLVLGFSCGIGFVLGPVAWIMGNSALSEIDANPSLYTNRGSVQAGRICGIIATVLAILGVVAIILLIAVADSSST